MSGDAKVTVKSSDDQIFVVDESVVFESEVLKEMTKDMDMDAQTIIPLLEVTGEIFAIIIEYCDYHVKVKKRSDSQQTISNDETQKWDAEFIKVHALTDYSKTCRLITAANYLYIPELLEFASQIVADTVMSKCADIITTKSADEFREYFRIIDDFGPGEQEEIRKENQWAFE